MVAAEGLWGEKASKRVIGDTVLHLGKDDEGGQEEDLEKRPLLGAGV